MAGKKFTAFEAEAASSQWMRKPPQIMFPAVFYVKFFLLFFSQ